MKPIVLHLARGREWRGGELQVLLLTQALAAREAISQLVITGRGTRLGRELRDAQLPVVEIAWRVAWDPRALAALLRRTRTLQRDGIHPILHAHDSHALSLALLCRRFTRTPVIATRRSMTVPGSQWRRADKVIAISHAVAASLRDAGVPPDRIGVVPSAVSVEHFREPGGETAEDGPGSIVALGADTPEKGHAVLREAISRLPEPQPRLTLMTGAIDPSALHQATIFVQPSLREALGTAVLVAMARGIPVIASRTGGLVELLEGGAGVLVPPGDPAALAVAIRQLLADQPLRAALIRTARRRVEEYRPARMADQVADVYASVHCEP